MATCVTSSVTAGPRGGASGDDGSVAGLLRPEMRQLTCCSEPFAGGLPNDVTLGSFMTGRLLYNNARCAFGATSMQVETYIFIIGAHDLASTYGVRV